MHLLLFFILFSLKEKCEHKSKTKIFKKYTKIKKEEILKCKLQIICVNKIANAL